MKNTFVENFKSEELEERLEFGSWSVSSEDTYLMDENGESVDSVGPKWTGSF